ncbi:cache domain-containing sensor histidine kinase [Paenibacillus piri]|uniref:histidine kinase n=1 Tax=Paenibacillus piri TaxID=2547395 RepID=A0A4R5K7A4_9BACL|nr:sensor histidine kinase [Paenibacillus piri]TDF89810.1 sensor histidine kinase [Paenibacillus piri]
MILLSRWKTVVHNARMRLNKIRTRLFLTYVVVTVLGICIIGTMSYRVSYKSLEDKAISNIQEKAAQVQFNLDYYFEQIKNVLIAPYFQTNFISGINNYDSMSTLDQLVYKQNLRDFFIKMYYVTPQRDFSGFFIFMSDGEMLFHTVEIDPEVIQKSFTQDNWVSKTVNTGGSVYFGGAEPDIYSSRPARNIFSASIIFRDISNQRNQYSVARTHYSLESIIHILNESAIGKGSKSVIVDKQGRIIYSTGEERAGEQFDPAILDLTSAGGYAWYKDKHGKFLVMSSKSGVPGWTTIFLTPETYIFDASNQIKRLTFGFAVIAILITAAVSFLFASSITKPIMQLYRSVTSIRLGNLRTRTAIGRDDEIGKIALNFNEMLDEIESLIQTKYVNQIKLKESELALLQSQINPHFLYNTLDSIRAIADHHHMENIALMTTSLGNMFRYSTTEGEFVSIEQELKHISDYVIIQKIRFGPKIQVEWDIEPETLSKPIYKISLQPIVENAILHGLEKKKGPGTLFIRTRIEDESIWFTIKDNGPGMAESKLKRIRMWIDHDGADFDDGDMDDKGKKLGIGLMNVHSRLRIIYGDRYSMSVQSEPGLGTTVSFRIPATP